MEGDLPVVTKEKVCYNTTIELECKLVTDQKELGGR